MIFMSTTLKEYVDNNISGIYYYAHGANAFVAVCFVCVACRMLLLQDLYARHVAV